MHFADTLKYLRESNDITQQDLANYLSVSRTTITGYETRSREPDYDKLIRLASYFQVSTDYLLGNNISTNQQDNLINIREKDIDHHLLSLYRQLSLKSKIDAAKYIELLHFKELHSSPKV